jgi:hypothetical protein
MKDILFLLPADFDDAGAPWYCRECAEVRGLLAYYPQLVEKLDVRITDYPRPRAAIVELLGEAHQNCPTLVIADDARELPGHVLVKSVNGRRFVDNAKAIGEYLAAAYGISRPHP